MTNPNLPLMNDAQAKTKLDELTKLFSTMRDSRIRNESDVKRCEAESKEARSDAETQFQTSDVATLRAGALENRTANTEALAAFEATLADVGAKLREISDAA